MNSKWALIVQGAKMNYTKSTATDLRNIRETRRETKLNYLVGIQHRFLLGAYPPLQPSAPFYSPE